MNMRDISSNFMDPFLEKVGDLSKVVRALISAGLLLVLIGSFTYFSFLPKLKEIEKLTKTHEKLVTKLTRSKKKAAKIDMYKSMMREAQAEFNTALKALPEKKEIPSLLTSVSRAGIDSGLEFILFQPQSEVMKEFYAEIPVSIQVFGGYHSVALFFDRVARLPRIVNIKNIKMNQSKRNLKLTTTCTAVTYRFVESSRKKAGKTGKKGRKRKKK
ncbi:MAG: type 4a pilus biogenesis protein PilO [Desulfobacterales bacterium]